MSLVKRMNQLIQSLMDYLANASENAKTPITIKSLLLQRINQHLLRHDASLPPDELIKHLKNLTTSNDFLQLPHKPQVAIQDQIDILCQLLESIDSVTQYYRNYLNQQSQNTHIKHLDERLNTYRQQANAMQKLERDQRITLMTLQETLNSKLRFFLEHLPSCLAERKQPLPYPPSPNELTEHTQYLESVSEISQGIHPELSALVCWNRLVYYHLTQQQLHQFFQAEGISISDLSTTTSRLNSEINSIKKLKFSIESVITDIYQYLTFNEYPEKIKELETDLKKIWNTKLNLTRSIQEFDSLKKGLKLKLQTQIDAPDPIIELRHIEALITEHTPSVISSHLYAGAMSLMSIVADTREAQKNHSQKQEQHLTIRQYLRLLKELTLQKIKESITNRKIQRLRQLVEHYQRIGISIKPAQDLFTQAHTLREQACAKLCLAPSPNEASLESVLSDLKELLPELEKSLHSKKTRRDQFNLFEQCKLSIIELFRDSLLSNEARQSYLAATIESIRESLSHDCESEHSQAIKPEQIAIQAWRTAEQYQNHLNTHSELTEHITQYRAGIKIYQKTRDKQTSLKQEIKAIHRRIAQEKSKQPQELIQASDIEHQVLSLHDLIAHLTPIQTPKPIKPWEITSSSPQNVGADEHLASPLIETPDYLEALSRHRVAEARLNNSPYKRWYETLYQQAQMTFANLNERHDQNRLRAIQTINLFHDLALDFKFAAPQGESPVLNAYRAEAPFEQESDYESNFNQLLHYKPSFLIEEAMQQQRLTHPQQNPHLQAVDDSLNALYEEALRYTENSKERILTLQAGKILQQGFYLATLGECHRTSLQAMQHDPHYHPLSKHRSFAGKLAAAFAKLFTWLNNLFHDETNQSDYRESFFFFKPRTQARIEGALKALAQPVEISYSQEIESAT